MKKKSTLKIYIRTIQYYTDVDPTVDFVFPVNKIDFENSGKNSYNEQFEATKCVFRSCNLWKLSKKLIVFLFLRTTVLCTSCLSYHYETVLHCPNFLSTPRFSIRGQINPQKWDILFLVQDRRNYRLYDIYTIIYRCPGFLSSQNMISPKATQNCVLSGEATNTNLVVFGWLDRGSSIRYIALEAMTLTISPLHHSTETFIWQWSWQLLSMKCTRHWYRSWKHNLVNNNSHLERQYLRSNTTYN